MKIILPVILLFIVITYVIACSKDESSSIPEISKQLNIPNNDTLVHTAVINSVIDPITIEVLQNNEKTIVKLIGLSIPEFQENPKIYESSLNFTKFHLHKGKKVQLQKDIYNTNEEFQWRYLFIDGEMYNKLMLTNGYAVTGNIHEQFEHKLEFQYIEQTAQDSNVGYWANEGGKLTKPNIKNQKPNSNEPAGTLPKINLKQTNCDYTRDNIPVIKGNYDKITKNKTYYLPDSIFYKTIDINSDDGDKLLCTESEAEKNGWVKSKH